MTTDRGSGARPRRIDDSDAIDDRWNPAWIPPFLVGGVAAAAGELAAGLLLYSTRGFLRSLTVVLATELLALGLGLASSRHLHRRAADLPAIRRRWLAAVLAFAAAAGFSATWSMSDGFGAAAWAQILGLTLLGGLPLFAVGSVLGAVGGHASGAPVTGPAAAFGAAAGVAATGAFGVPNLQPTSVFLLCVVAVSSAALVHGWLLDREVVVRTVSEDGGEGGETVLRLEERALGSTGERARLVTVDGRVAMGRDDEGRPLLAWERATGRLLARTSDGLDRVLLVGGTAGGLLRTLQSASGGPEIVAVEPWERSRRLGAGRTEKGGRSSEGRETAVEERWPLEREPGCFDAVIVAVRLLPGGGLRVGPALDLLAEVAAARSSRGILVLGGLARGAGSGEPDEAEWVRGRSWCPERLEFWAPEGSGEGAGGDLLGAGEARYDGLLLGGPGDEPWETRIVEAMGAAGMVRLHGARGSNSREGPPAEEDGP